MTPRCGLRSAVFAANYLTATEPRSHGTAAAAHFFAAARRVRSHVIAHDAMRIKKPKPFVLVLMSFADDYDDVYQLGIKPACVAVGAVCERVDEQSYQGAIIQQIYDQIARADLIVSDLSNGNLNVFYETGYAHALGKKVILLTRREGKIPFNTGNYPHVVYERDKIAKLRSELERRAKALLGQPPPVIQPPARQPPPSRPSPASAAAPKAGEIENIYLSRLDATTAFEEIVADKNIRTLYVVGISLRDLLTEHGRMRGVWKKLRGRLAKENAAAGKTAPGRRLQVRLLLLDPQSGAGFFRYKVEKRSAIREGKVDAHDINAALLEIEDAVKKVYGDRPQHNLEARLYEHCPFSFLFLTNRSVFVEQYYYKSSDEGTQLPLVEYGARSAAYQQLRASFDIIWENAHRGRIRVGTTAPVERARVKNIFRVEDRDEQWGRQIECIRNAGAGAVDILSITGRFYSDREQKALVALKEISAKRRRTHARVRFALLNPVCQQAIFRAIADTYSIKQMRLRCAFSQMMSNEALSCP